MTDILEQVKTTLGGAPKVESHEIELCFFSTKKKANLQAKKEGSPAAPSVKLTEKGYEYNFEKPIFAENIQVFCPENEKHGPKIRVDIRRASDGAIVRLDGGQVSDEKALASVPVGALISGFSVRSARGRLEFNDKISGIKVSGWFSDDFDAIEAAAVKYSELLDAVTTLVEDRVVALSRGEKSLADAKAAHEDAVQAEKTAHETALQAEKAAHEKAVQAEKTALDNERAEHIKQVEKLKAEEKVHQEGLAVVEKTLKEKTTELTAVTERLSKTEETKAQRESLINELNGRHDSLVDRIREKDAEIEIKSQKAAKLNEELLHLNSDKSLFTDDMIGFTRQGAGQVKSYILWILAPALLIGGALAGLSVYGAIDLFNKFVANTTLHGKAWELVMLKMPFVMLASAIYTFLYKFAKPFIGRIIEIHTRRMRLSEITILASKFSDSALEGSELADKERLAAKMDSRMMLVRAYLSGQFDPKTPAPSKAGDRVSVEPPKPLEGIASGRVLLKSDVDAQHSSEKAGTA